jgi:hypothetical protein
MSILEVRASTGVLCPGSEPIYTGLEGLSNLACFPDTLGQALRLVDLVD